MAKTPTETKTATAAPAPMPRPYTIAMLGRSAPHKFDLRPTDEERLAVMKQLGLMDLDGLRVKGALIPARNEGWRVEARLTATVSQACVVTLEAVSQNIDETINRRFELLDPDTTPLEIDLDPSVDDDDDFFLNSIDVGEVAVESLALALEPYPRKDGAILEASVFSEPGATALTDEAMKPFAQLSELRKRMTPEKG